MAIKYLSNIDLTNGQLKNFKVDNVTADPSVTGEGQMIWRSDVNQMKFYDGSAWQTIGTSGGSVTSVGLSISNSTALAVDASSTPITGSGTLDLDWQGTASQVVLGDGTMGTLTSGTMSSFILSADSGSNQTIVDGNTIDIAGTAGRVETVVGNTDTVTIDLATSGVTAGSYTSADITVDAYGRITTAASGGAGTMSSWTLSGDSGSSQTINDGNTVDIAGGTGIDTVAGSMKSLLSFQDSLNAEIEASIMLGRDVNLQKARELALAGKADEFAVELTKQVGSQAEFEKMNVLQRQSLAKALGISVEQMAKMVNNQDKVRTIGEAISEQDGLEKMIGRESMDNMAKIVADLQRVGTELVISIGPTVAAVAGGFASFTKALSESKLLMPALISLMGLFATKSLASAYSQLVVASALSGFGVGSLILAGIATTALLAGLSALPSFQNLPKNQSANITQGQAIADPGESIVHTEVLQNMSKPQGVSQESLNTAFQGAVNIGNNGISKDDMETAFTKSLQPLIAENRMMREQNENLINETRRGPQRTADALLA
mgnify:CR=1 FL=1